jgi:hypothetical protein
MKAIVNNDNENTRRPFPKLMISDATPGDPMDRIVLFTAPREGTSIIAGHGGADVAIGYFSQSWEMRAFRDFEGSVTLSND